MSEEDDAPGGDDAKRGERIAKHLARAGVASRRDAEKLIAEGKVKLNGKLVETPATFVGPGDRISVDGKPVAAPERTRLFRYHKPEGLVTTHRDPEGRPTVFGKLPAALPRVVSIGRLDITSEGLLLLTNDGELARRLELPSNGWLRRYRVRVFGRVDERSLAALSRGITIEGVAYGPIEAGLDSRQGGNAWLTVSLKEGKNREVRRVMAHLGLQVTRLIRVAYGPFQLGALPRGGVEEVHPRIMREQLGIGEKPQRRRGADAAAETPPAPPEPKPPGRGHTIPRARNAAPRRPARAASRRRPPSRP
jgi:23S rRNA pseudouridine2605 synthase